MGEHGRLVVEVYVDVLVAVLAGEAGGQQALRQAADAADAEPAVVQIRSLPDFRREELLPQRVVDDAGHEPAGMLEPRVTANMGKP